MFQDAHKSGVVFLIIGAQLWVHAVRGTQILRQVVCTYADKVHFLCHKVGNQRDGRHLDHDPDLHVLRVGDAGRVQFIRDL